MIRDNIYRIRIDYISNINTIAICILYCISDNVYYILTRSVISCAVKCHRTTRNRMTHTWRNICHRKYKTRDTNYVLVDCRVCKTVNPYVKYVQLCRLHNSRRSLSIVNYAHKMRLFGSIQHKK